MKKLSKAIKIIVCIALSVVVLLGVWQLSVHIRSSKYDLITLDTSVLPDPITEPGFDGFVQLSDVNVHYRIYGEKGKQPLLLIHGNGGSCNSLSEAATYLANDYTVYVPESRCHGQSSDPGEITYKLMAKDIYEFCKKLKIKKPYIMGHSDGGINALTVACEYPDLPGAIISCGANTVPSEFKPYFTIGVKLNNIFHPDKLNDLMLTLPDFTKEDFAKIKCPSYIVAAEFDIMWLSDNVYIADCIENSRFSIIKWANHGSYMSHDGKQAYALAKGFFDTLEK